GRRKTGWNAGTATAPITWSSTVSSAPCETNATTGSSTARSRRPRRSPASKGSIPRTVPYKRAWGRSSIARRNTWARLIAPSSPRGGCYARRDERNPELAFPPEGLVMSYEEALHRVAPEVRARYRGPEPFQAQAEACQRALDELSGTLRGMKPDITVIIGDDQDEWFYDD